MKTKLFAANLAIFGFILVGPACKTHSDNYTNNTATEVQMQFIPLGKHIKHSITCTECERRVLSDGRTAVTANIQNRENKRIQVQIQCVFKDAQGFSSEGDESPFQNLILNENSKESVHFVSMNNKAVEYDIKVRDAK